MLVFICCVSVTYCVRVICCVSVSVRVICCVSVTYCVC